MFNTAVFSPSSVVNLFFLLIQYFWLDQFYESNYLIQRSWNNVNVNKLILK